MIQAVRRNRFKSTVHPVQIDYALGFLLPISQSYPGFEKWYADKVVPGVMLGTRRLTIIEREGVIAGVGIAKNELGEKKLCTIRVNAAYEGRGIGVRIFDDLLDWLGTDRPLATVSEEKMPAFERIFSRQGFVLTSVGNGVYRPGRLEYYFNETPSPLMS